MLKIKISAAELERLTMATHVREVRVTTVDHQSPVAITGFGIRHDDDIVYLDDGTWVYVDEICEVFPA